MLSPATLPVKASVSGIGLVMESFQANIVAVDGAVEDFAAVAVGV